MKTILNIGDFRKRPEMKILNDESVLEAQKLVSEIENQLVETIARRQEIETELSKPPAEHQDVFARFQASQIEFQTGKDSLRKEYAELEQREQLLTNYATDARRELERRRGFASVPNCDEARPEFVREIKRGLDALHVAYEVNQNLRRMRNDLESAGNITGSLPYCLIDNIGAWDDPLDIGIAQIYRRWVRENYGVER